MTDDVGTSSSVVGGDPNTSSPLLDSTALAQLSYESAQLSAAAKQDSPPENSMGDVNPRAAELDYQHAQAAAAAATGAGFEFTPEQINTQLAHCEQQLKELATDLFSAQSAEQAVHAPAPDAASVAQANAVRNMLTETIAAIRADMAYLTDWQTKLTDAQTLYMETEHLTADQWNRLANGMQS
jgi:alpha/beta superfamily hydrolase